MLFDAGPSECFYPEYALDDYCDDLNNVPECNYDGGACCGSNVLTDHCDDCLCKGQKISKGS